MRRLLMILLSLCLPATLPAAGEAAAVTTRLSAATGSEYAASRERATEGNGPGAACGNAVDGPRVCHS